MQLHYYTVYSIAINKLISPVIYTDMYWEWKSSVFAQWGHAILISAGRTNARGTLTLARE